jgi:hypothetical protein
MMENRSLLRFSLATLLLETLRTVQAPWIAFITSSKTPCCLVAVS